MKTTSAEFPALSRAALAQPTLQRSLAGVRRMMPALRSAALSELPDFAQLRDRAREIRERSLAGLEGYLLEFERHAMAAGAEVHWARTAEEACAIVGGICERAGARTVIKSKSMVTEEIDLNEDLERRGMRVTETDLGEYIIQLRAERPSHILAPALHLSLAEVGETFERSHARKRTEPLTTAGQMLVEAREELRERIPVSRRRDHGGQFPGGGNGRCGDRHQRGQCGPHGVAARHSHRGDGDREGGADAGRCRRCCSGCWHVRRSASRSAPTRRWCTGRGGRPTHRARRGFTWCWWTTVAAACSARHCRTSCVASAVPPASITARYTRRLAATPTARSIPVRWAPS